MKLVYGVGINDAGYVVQPTINGERVRCPYYIKWESMLKRCYSVKYHEANPTYIGCEVSEDWKTFSNFKAWMQTQNWVGYHLDKDILIQGNKLYSNATCVFVSSNVNTFLLDHANGKGNYLIGVYWCKSNNRFKAQCCDGVGKQKSLGYFDDELSAHIAWKTYKHKLACKLADEQTDPRIAEALRTRFL